MDIYYNYSFKKTSSNPYKVRLRTFGKHKDQTRKAVNDPRLKYKNCNF